MKKKEINQNEEIEIPPTNYFNQNEVEASGKQIQTSMHKLHRKSLANAYYNYLVKLEMNERKISYIFGPFHTEDGNIFTFQDSIEAFLEEIDALRSNKTYAHKVCAGKFTQL